MWIRVSSELSENTCQLVTSVSSHVLVRGDENTLVDAGISATAEQLLDELAKYLDSGTALNNLLLTHAHFDHIGGIYQLKKSFPELKVVASPLCAELLQNKDYVRALYEKNKTYAEALKSEMEIGEEEFFSQLRIDQTVRDGDVLQLEPDVEVKVIGCSGHTEDGLAFLFRPDGVLAGAEAFGSYGGRDRHFPCFTADYHAYLEILDRLSEFEISCVSLPHGGALSGELAVKYLLEASTAARRLYDSFKDRFSAGEIVDEVYSSFAADWINEGYAPEGPFTAETEECLKKMIQVAAQD